ncbi:MAG: Hpt domain-containing protein [Verrucomicrobia bacterium]|nr:Hpt domain-containing protein [Verrucomicrobiota bacterium]
MSAPALIDPQTLANLRALNPDDNDAFLKEIVGMYLEDTPLRIAELESSLAQGDAKAFARAAHSIRGASANLGASALHRAAEQLELRVRNESPSALASELALLKELFAQTDRELRRLFS